MSYSAVGCFLIIRYCFSLWLQNDTVLSLTTLSSCTQNWQCKSTSRSSLHPQHHSFYKVISIIKLCVFDSFCIIIMRTIPINSCSCLVVYGRAFDALHLWVSPKKLKPDVQCCLYIYIVTYQIQLKISIVEINW